MKKNFDIKDGVVFSFLGKSIDLRRDCEFFGVEFRPGESSTVEMLWNMENSNRMVRFVFSSVIDFLIKGRDSDYPLESGTSLSIAGFSDRNSYSPEGEFYVDAAAEASYMSFVMDDTSAFLVKAETADMQMV